jgi:hypothetical protein
MTVLVWWGQPGGGFSKANARLLLPAEMLGKTRDIDQAAGMAAFADPALVIESLDFEPDHPPTGVAAR